MPKDHPAGQGLVLDYEKTSRVVQALYQTVLDGEGSAESDSDKDGFISKNLARIAALFE